MSATRRKARAEFLNIKAQNELCTSILDRIYAKTDKRPEQFLELLEERAKEISPDYPFDGSDAFDWLWAIVSSYTGTHQANQECHAFIKYLGTKTGLDDNGIYQEWINFWGENK